MSRLTTGDAEPPPAAPFAAEEQAALERGVAQFNDRLFFECHDTLEDLWSGLRGAERDFVQGLIQVAVGFYHLGNGNHAGAVRLFDRGLLRLARYPAHYAGLDGGSLRSAVAVWREAAAKGGSLPSPPPRIERAPREAT